MSNIEKTLKLFEDLAEDTNEMSSIAIKKYRILESLEGIPLDTRIPLDKIIPPFNKYVMFIFEDVFAKGKLWKIDDGLVCLSGDIASSKYKTLEELTGYWMRIV